MLKPKALGQVLASVCSGGVHTALVMNMEGGLLAFSGPSERDAVLHAAMATNAWTVYEKNGTPMRSILVEIESGAVLTVRVTPSLALCLISDESIELGILRQKGFTLAAYLEAPLKQIQA